MGTNDSNRVIDERSLNRLKLVLFAFLLLFCVVVARLAYIQIFNSAKYKKLAELQHIKKVELKAKRGEIYDRNGVLLASTLNSRSFAIDPLIVRKNNESLERFLSFTKILGLEKQIFSEVLSSNKRFLWVKRGLIDYPRELDTFSFPGLISLTQPKRFYLYGNSVSNLIGLTNLDNVGVAGIEYSLDSILKGIDGFSYFLKDALGRLVPDIELPSVPPIDGRSIRLTIDINLQRLVSYFLTKGVQETAAKGGCIIALNPKTGEILALANFPNFDPANTSQLSNETLNNYAVNFAFEPGSTLKPLIAAIGLERNIISEAQLFDGYNGKFTFGDVVIVDEHPFSKLTLKDALVFSSNIAFAQIAGLIPTEILEQSLKKLGFGSKTGIHLPGELKGYITREDSLTLVQRMFIGYGYGIYTTPLQVAMAYCAIANSGLLPKAKILLDEVETSLIDTIFKKETTDILKNYLIDVVNIGTATGTKVEGISIAGKTGTSQKFEQGKYSKTLYTNTFVGFLPAENPKFLMLILLDEPKSSIYASSTVVPLFRSIVLAMTNSKLSSYIYD